MPPAPTLSRLDTAPDLVDQVYRKLLDAISDGSMAPGTRLTQEDVAEQLAVSRQPVLQALRQLRADGLVQDALGPQGQKGRGVVVTPIDATTVAQVYEVRSALDAQAARLAARRRAVIDPALITAGRTAAAAGQVKAMIDADLAPARCCTGTTYAAPWVRPCSTRPCAPPPGTNTRPCATPSPRATKPRPPN